MTKLLKLCFACCLMLRATFVCADYEAYQKYITALKELEEQYKNVDRTIDLSGCTMREVVQQLHDILQLRAHSKIGTSQEQDSHPTLLKVNNVIYELYFLETKDQPGNCRLKQQGKKAKGWWKGYEYNSELNTEENYVEQNLLFCLEIARRSVRGVTEIHSEEVRFLEASEEASESWIVPIFDDQKDKFKGLDIVGVIVIGLNLVNNGHPCSSFSFLGCFTEAYRKNIAENLIKKVGLSGKDLGKLKSNFFNKKIDDRVINVGCEQYFKNDLSDLINNSDVIKKLKNQNFTHWESIENLTPEVLNTTNLAKGATSEGIIEEIKSIDFPQLELCEDTVLKLADYFSSFFNYTEKKKKTPVYIINEDENKNVTVSYTLFTMRKRQEDKQEYKISKTVRDEYFSKGFVFLHATGKDGITRWFYLNKSNSTLYLLSESGQKSLTETREDLKAKEMKIQTDMYETNLPEIKSQIEDQGYYIQDVSGDGNCGFHAILQSGGWTDSPKNVQILRKNIFPEGDTMRNDGEWLSMAHLSQVAQFLQENYHRDLIIVNSVPQNQHIDTVKPDDYMYTRYFNGNWVPCDSFAVVAPEQRTTNDKGPIILLYTPGHWQAVIPLRLPQS